MAYTRIRGFYIDRRNNAEGTNLADKDQTVISVRGRGINTLTHIPSEGVKCDRGKQA